VAYIGKRFRFHGAFSTRARAERKHKRVKKSFIRKVKIRKDTRYLVLGRK